MENIKIGKVYRHFKGNYVFVENTGTYFDGTPVVIYKGLNNGKIYVRPISVFNEEVEPERDDNITNQKYRFEIANDLSENYLK